MDFMRNYVFCACCGILLSCSETQDPDPEVVGFNYFPLELGTYRTYQVDKITYSLVVPTDTARYQMKELVADTFHTPPVINYILHRFSRSTDEDSWQLDSVWTARRTENHAVLVENNIPYVKIVFPVRRNKIWNGNLFNSMPVDEYEITEIGGSTDTPAGVFNDVLTVFENDDRDTLIFQDIRQSIYARNVGLIYRKSSILKFCNTDPDCLGTLESGTKFEQVLVDYGKE